MYQHFAYNAHRSAEDVRLLELYLWMVVNHYVGGWGTQSQSSGRGLFIKWIGFMLPKTTPTFLLQRAQIPVTSMYSFKFCNSVCT